MSKIINEMLVVEVKFPWGRLSGWNKERIEEMMKEYVKSCINLNLTNSITLTGIITGVGSEGYEEKNIKVEIP